MENSNQETISNLIGNPVLQMRKNHALEHVVIHVLEKKFPGRQLMGYSICNGFWIIGNLSIQNVQEAVDAAFARLSHGEKNLAIHEGCGTNLATTGVLASVAALLTLAGTKSEKERLRRFSSLVLMTCAFVQISKPLGFAMQRNVTTDADMDGMKIMGIDMSEICGFQCFFVTTGFNG